LSIIKLHDYRLKQKILYIDKANPDVLQHYGDLFLEAGKISDALEFYQKANNSSGMQKIKNIAFDSGDVMLFQQAAKALNLELKPIDWEGIGQKAIASKKYSFAQHALEKANNEELVNSLKKIRQKEETGKTA
jgi:tetratricopeptide (TPR) repeat protein